MRKLVRAIFNEGDTVKLKGIGSPNMRVCAVSRPKGSSEFVVSCVWFTEDVQQEDFLENQIEVSLELMPITAINAAHYMYKLYIEHSSMLNQKSAVRAIKIIGGESFIVTTKNGGNSIDADVRKLFVNLSGARWDLKKQMWLRPIGKQ
jgi:uncharacterized protein YodC (DUF2158 family)